jgi:uncharacterized membrane protein
MTITEEREGGRTQTSSRKPRAHDGERGTFPRGYAAAIGGAAIVIALGLFWRSMHRGDTRTRLGGDRGTDVDESFAINRPAAELYGFWRELSHLPSVIPELASVEMISPTRSHWIAHGPVRSAMTWDADIINDIPNELIAWRTIEGSTLVSAGSVHFDERARHRGTVVRIKLQYDPPGGTIAAALARAIDRSPSQVIREGLRRFKQLMETGEIPTTQGQPRGAR